VSLNVEEYTGQRVLVTGAASGMGAAVVELLTAAGAEVHAADRTEVRAPVAAWHPCDLSTEEGVAALVEAVPTPTSVFACAGLPQTNPGADVIAVNFLANRALVAGLAPDLAPGAAIAVVSSVTYGWERMLRTLGPLVVSDGFAAGLAWFSAHEDEVGDPYVASKMALTAWAVSAAPGLAERGIRLNVLGPGTTKTPMLPEFEAAVGAQLAAAPCPIGRLSEADEQARALLFLNAPSSSYLAGAVLYNDGGMSASFGAMAVEAAR